MKLLKAILILISVFIPPILIIFSIIGLWAAEFAHNEKDWNLMYGLSWIGVILGLIEIYLFIRKR